MKGRPSAASPTAAAWVLACQHPDGGFGSFPGDISALRPTACALEVLKELGLAIPRPGRLVRFLLSQQMECGAFRGRPWGLRWQDIPTLINSHYGLRALQALERPVPRASALISFVRSRQRPDGAFLEDLYPEQGGVSAQTFCAVALLRALGAEVPAEEQVAAFLRRLQAQQVRGDGGFIYEDTPEWEKLVQSARAWAASATPYRDPGPEEKEAIPVAVGYTAATYFACAALSLLDSRPPDPQAALRFLCSQQHPAGGFLTGLGDYGAYHDRSEGRLSDTYHALAALRLLATAEAADPDRAWASFIASGAIDAERCAAWIESCQNPDGGFARRPDSLSRPGDMEAVLHAVRSLGLLGRAAPQPAQPVAPRREELSPDLSFPLSSAYFQPDQPGQALYLHRIVAPIRAALRSDLDTAVGLLHWTNRHLVFANNYRNEAALLVEDAASTCGGQARCLAGLCQAAGIPSRFLLVAGHCVTEALLDGRWSLLDPMFDGAFPRAGGGLCSAFDVRQSHLRGDTEITTFGDWRYRSFAIYWPQPGAGEREIRINADDGPDSPSVRAAYPELSR